MACWPVSRFAMHAGGTATKFDLLAVSWSGVYSNGYEPLGALYETSRHPDTRHQPRAHFFSRLVVVRESCIRLYASAKAHHLLFEKAELQSIHWLYRIRFLFLNVHPLPRSICYVITSPNRRFSCFHASKRTAEPSITERYKKNHQHFENT